MDQLLTIVSVAVDKSLGNPEGWLTGFNFKSQQRGAATYVFAAFDPSLKGKSSTHSILIDYRAEPDSLLDHNGAYLLDSRVGDPRKDTIKPWATSKVEAERLWKLSEKLVSQEFTY